ncbi:MAG TPA: FxSxx-COOH system tetratricopeptide repeat protein [Trebonia sp.]|jgi:tetratricopeptide (TPR) repeat protein
MASGSGDSGGFSQPPGKRRRHTYVWGSEIPFRNPHFTGRELELQALRAELQAEGSAVIRQPPSALYGLGGVGKTQIATEYAHRYAEEYEVVWWVRSDQEDSIQASLVALGNQLRLAEISPGDRDRSMRLVIDALQSGDPYSRWLLIFDDVTQPNKLRRYIPQGGHVIVTSRINEWRQVLNTDGIEVREFDRAETVKFLRDRVPQLAPASSAVTEAVAGQDAERLAAALGDLPLAAEHAVSYLTQTGVQVGDYIAAFERDAHALLGQEADMFASNRVVSTTWSVTRHSLSPEARELFQLLAFFAAEPISEEILLPGQLEFDPPLSEPLHKVLSSRSDLKRAQRELARFSLISVYGQRNVAQLHRVVQAVTRARIEKEAPDLAQSLQQAVFSLLAATDPDSPEREQNDSVYRRTIAHLIPTGALKSDNARVRNLTINQVRRLRMRGGNREALRLGQAALDVWKSSPDDIQTLAVAAEIGMAQRELGQVEEAFRLNTDTLRRLREQYGTDDDTYLLVADSYSEDLRVLGKYDEALEHDLALLPVYDQVFSPGQFWPLSLRNNIAIDLRCVGRYEEALRYDAEVADERERYFGSTNLPLLSSKFGVARDLRHLCRYEESLEVCREITSIMEARGEPHNFSRLLMDSGLAVSLRWAGYFAEAHAVAEDTYRQYVGYAGEGHRATLTMATNLMCDRRLVNDLEGAAGLGAATVAAWEKATSGGHPCTLNAKGNLAVILRAQGYPAAALDMNQRVLEGLRDLYSYDHPTTLIVMTHLASDLAAIGEARQAREVGEEVVAKSTATRGPLHTCTLAAAVNLAHDLRATGDRDAARELEDRALAGFDEKLSPEHPLTRRARQRGRVDLEIEPVFY